MGIQYYTELQLVQSCSVRRREKVGVAGGTHPLNPSDSRINFAFEQT